jgi:serine/threonine protein phosphatase 1
VTLQSPLTFAIGDVHGCREKLVSLIEHCLEFAQGRPPRFVCLGDYVDRGPDSAGVVAFLMERQRIEPGRFICLRGNHDDMLVTAVDGDGEAHWLTQGGLMTLMSYGADRALDLPDDHVDWFRHLPLLHRDDLRVYVHAGLIPGLPLKQQPAEALMWIREPFLEYGADHGFLVVHGHTPVASRRPDLRANRLNMDTGAVFGGPLSAAAFDDALASPLAFIADDGSVRILASS